VKFLDAYRDYIWWGNLTLRKILNAARYLRAKRRPSPEADYLPPFVMIETGNVCRLECPFCSQGLFKAGVQPNGRMLDPKTFALLLDRIRGTTLILDLFKHGEPLLNPHLPELIAMAWRSGVRCRVNSALNARLNDDYIRRLCDSRLYKLTCAIDGTTQPVYERYRQGGSLELVLDNARRILRARRRRPWMIYRMLVFEWNHHQIAEARRLAAGMGFDRFLAEGGVSLAGGQAVRWNVGRARWEPEAWHLESVLPAAPEGPVPAKAERPCVSLTGHFVIHSDGRAAVCCHSHREEWLQENVLEAPLDQIWNSPAYQASRAYTAGLAADRDSVFPQCRRCPWL
jgi:pyruvate-formate lyase-activating enzyme